MALVGGGIILTFQSMQTYVVDCFTLHAASGSCSPDHLIPHRIPNFHIPVALAAVSCLRALAGFGFPLFTPAMYDALGFGKGNTILAAVSIAVGWPA